MYYFEHVLDIADLTCTCLEEIGEMRPSLISFIAAVAVIIIDVLCIIIPLDFVGYGADTYRTAFMNAAHAYNTQLADSENQEDDCSEESEK